MFRSTIFLVLLLVTGLARAGDIQQLLQLIEYIGVDYAGAVGDGAVINPGEYDEMREFTVGIAEQVRELPAGGAKADLQRQAARLAERVATRARPAQIRALATAMRLAIIESYEVTVVPLRPPDLARARVLYTERCASCHGAGGDGRGPLAAGLDPAPADFRDPARYAQRTLYGLYSTITQGVGGTAMKPYRELSADARWALAFYVGGLGAGEVAPAAAESLLADPALAPLATAETLAVITPAAAGAEFGDAGARLMAYLRTHPRALFEQRSPLEFSRRRLDDVAAAYRAGERERAYRLAVEAYLEGFELVEQGLEAVDAGLRQEIERAMTGVRGSIRGRVPAAALAAEIAAVQALLDTAAERLHQRSLTGGAAFASAFFILVREGLEALLVVVALAAFLIKTEHRSSLRYLHIGWVGALLVGFATWLVSQSLIDISGVSREITEGVAALLATAVLFYVGFWLHHKTSAAQWQAFIETNVRRALGAGNLWGLAGLSFIAVYREVFETILFLEALWVQTDTAGKSMATSGFGAGVAVLALLAWVIVRYSARLPLRQFFSVTGVLMFVLAVVFAGKGVAALQEAGFIQVSPVNFPRIDLLGIYPNLQGLALQLGLLVLALVLWYGLPGKRRTAA